MILTYFYQFSEPFPLVVFIFQFKVFYFSEIFLFGQTFITKENNGRLRNTVPLLKTISTLPKVSVHVPNSCGNKSFLLLVYSLMIKTGLGWWKLKIAIDEVLYLEISKIVPKTFVGFIYCRTSKYYHQSSQNTAWKIVSHAFH